MPRYHEQIAAECARRVRHARDKKAEMYQLIDEINGLTHDDRGRPLTREDRLLIVDLVVGGPPRRLGELEYRPPVPLSGDNRSYLQLVASLKMMIR